MGPSKIELSVPSILPVEKHTPSQDPLPIPSRLDTPATNHEVFTLSRRGLLVGAGAALLFGRSHDVQAAPDTLPAMTEAVNAQEALLSSGPGPVVDKDHQNDRYQRVEALQQGAQVTLDGRFTDKAGSYVRAFFTPQGNNGTTLNGFMSTDVFAPGTDFSALKELGINDIPWVPHMVIAGKPVIDVNTGNQISGSPLLNDENGKPTTFKVGKNDMRIAANMQVQQSAQFNPASSYDGFYTSFPKANGQDYKTVTLCYGANQADEKPTWKLFVYDKDLYPDNRGVKVLSNDVKTNTDDPTSVAFLMQVSKDGLTLTLRDPETNKKITSYKMDEPLYRPDRTINLFQFTKPGSTVTLNNLAIQQPPK